MLISIYIYYNIYETFWNVHPNKCNHFGMTTVRVFVKITSIPDEELFSETFVMCTASYFVYIVCIHIWCIRWFCSPLPYMVVYSYICGRRRVTVARYWIICLVLQSYFVNRWKCPFSVRMRKSRNGIYIDSTGNVWCYLKMWNVENKWLNDKTSLFHLCDK